MTFPLHIGAAAQLDEMVCFTQSMLQASAAVMFWINGDRTLHEARTSGVSDAMRTEYFESSHRYDPLHPLLLADKGARMAFLHQELPTQREPARAIHMDFMTRHGILDEVDFLIWQNDTPVALLSVMKRACDPQFPTELFQWEPLRRHLEFGILQHPRLHAARKVQLLKREFNLTPREIEVLDLLQIGASNAKIAQIMSITVPTVKTHVVNILNKTGVDSRFAVAAYAASL